ncbi:MAG TPA: MGMT family protein [bacterium (Candidatus Stahlbacteria)]|nr:MGMT family protein [Candidatus Stahlbacteria bacterium]
MARRVYLRLSRIPFGETRTYAELAEELNSSARAIGQLLKKNPFPIIIPCHRVVGKASLGGFSAGISWKINLLRHERCF